MSGRATRGHSHWRLYLLLLGPVGWGIVIAGTIGEAVVGLLALAGRLLWRPGPDEPDPAPRRRYRRREP